MKAIQVLKTVKKERLPYLRKFLSSPYHNNRATVLQYFDAIKDFYPKFDPVKMPDKVIFAKAFPGETFSKNKLHKVRNSLMKCVKDFLVFDAIKTNQTLRQKILINDYLHSELDYLPPTDFNAIAADIEKASTNNQDSYLEQFQFQFLHYFKPKSELKSYNSNNQFNELLMQFRRSTLFTKLMLTVDGLNNYRVKGTQPELELTISELAEIKKIFPEDHPKVLLYLKLHDLLKLDQTRLDLFLDAKSIFVENLSCFSANEIKSLVNILISYTVRAIMHLDDEDFKKQQWDIYQFGIKSNALKDENYFHPSHFFNIVSIGAELKKDKAVEEFIKKNNKTLKDDIKKNIMAFSWATFYFKRGKFWKVIDELDKVNFEEWIYKLRVKSLQLRTYFEMRLSGNLANEFFISELEQFQKFIKKQVPKGKRAEYLRYNEWLTLLNRLILEGKTTEEEYLSLLQQVDDEAKLITRKWIRTKVVQLRKQAFKNRA